MGESLWSHILNIENITPSHGLQQDKHLNLSGNWSHCTKLAHQQYNIPGIKIRWGQWCPFNDRWVRLPWALFGQIHCAARFGCKLSLPAMVVPQCFLTVFTQVLFSGHFWDFCSGQDWKPKAGLKSSSSPTFPSGSTANLSLSSSLPLLTLMDGPRWGLETRKQKDEQCKRRRSILPNSPFFLKYFGTFILKQTSTREDEGGPRLNLSAEREHWQEVCLSSSFCNFVLARGSVLTSPGAWKSFPSIGQADGGIPSLHLETKLHGRRKRDSRFMLGLMLPHQNPENIWGNSVPLKK